MNGIDCGYRTPQGDFDYEEPETYITDDGRCSACGYYFDFDDMSNFVVEDSGVSPGSHFGPDVHWVTGTVTCPQCGEKYPYETSD